MTTLPTETVTRWVQKDARGRVIAVLNEYAAHQLGGVLETWTVPALDEAHAALMAVEGTRHAVRENGGLAWSVSPDRDVNSRLLADRIKTAIGWRAVASPSGGSVFVWPPATPA